MLFHCRLLFLSEKAEVLFRNHKTSLTIKDVSVILKDRAFLDKQTQKWNHHQITNQVRTIIFQC